MNFPRIEWGKGKRFDFSKYLDQPLLKTSKEVTFESLKTSSIYGVDRIQSKEFKHNLYNGSGWALWKNNHNKYNLEVDNLWVRGTMTIWELVINQLRASNGTLIIASCAKVEEDGAEDNGATFNLTFESNSSTASLQPFAVDDIIVAKRFTMPNDGATPTTLEQSVCTVTAISVDGDHAKITVTVDGTYGDPGGGMEFVRVGNTTDANRQSCVVISSDGIDSDDDAGDATVPFIQTISGIDTFAKFLNAMAGDTDYITSRMGRLDSITGGLNEWGFWGSVVHLQGGSGSGWGTVLEGDGTPVGTLDPDDYTVGTLYYDYTNQVYYLCTTGTPHTWTLMAGGIGENGELGIPAAPATGGNGLYASGDYLGFYDSGGWKGYWLNSGADAGDFFLKGASNTCMWWDYSAAALYIGGTASGHAYLKTVAGAGNIEFHDIYDRTPMVIGSNLDSSGVFSGISFGPTGFIYKKDETNPGYAVSTLHSELYNQSALFIGGISTLVSSTDDAGTPSLTTVNIMCGIKAQSYVTGAYTGSGIVAVTNGNTTGDVYGIYAHSTNAGTGYGWAGYFVNQVYINENLQIYGYAKVGTGAVNTSGMIRIATHSSYIAAGGIWFGDTTNKVSLYQSAVDKLTIGGKLKVDSSFEVGTTSHFNGDITTSALIDTVDIAAHKALTDNLNGHGFKAYLTTTTSFSSETKTLSWTEDWEDSFGTADNFGSTIFTCGYTGRYLFNVKLTFNSISSGCNWIKITLVTAGGNHEYYIDPKVYDQATGYFTYSFSAIQDMSATDTAAVTVEVDTGTCDILNTVQKSTFEGYIIGIDS